MILERLIFYDTQIGHGFAIPQTEEASFRTRYMNIISKLNVLENKLTSTQSLELISNKAHCFLLLNTLVLECEEKKYKVIQNQRTQDRYNTSGYLLAIKTDTTKYLKS